MKKQIIFLTGAMGRGGAERVISLLSHQYVQKGWHVRIIQLLHNEIGYALDPEVEVLDFSNDKIKAVLDMGRLIVKVRNFVKREKPDVVVAFMAPICLIAGFACRGLNTRLVTSERNDPSQDYRNPVFQWALNDVYTKADLTVFQTMRVRNYFSENIRKNSVIIPNPIQVKCVAQDSRKPRIVTAGRLMPQKNQEMLIRAFERVSHKYPQYTLDIYGEGPLRQKLQSQIDSLGMEKAIVLQGNVPDIHERIKDAAFFVLPSDFEGLSNALLEAMMMGLPCISTNCAGSDEVIRHGENGLLIPVGDEDALALAMEKLICDPELAQKLGQSAKVDSTRFEVEKVIDQWNHAIEG